MYSVILHFVDGNIVTINLQENSLSESDLDIFKSLQKSIRNGMWLRIDNKLVDLGKVTYIEVLDIPEFKEE